jgi:predicted outer membrane repeat protein
VDGNFLSQIENCTFTLNTTGVAGGDDGYGGAISGGNLALRNVTIVDNHAEASGGAIFAEEGAPASLDNSLLSGNTASNEWGLALACRRQMDGSHNLQWPAPSEQDVACTADALAAEPLLGELSDNGGATMTIPLLAGSPAIDAGEGCAATDQRGLPRTGACDLGAFEVQ